MKACIDSSVIKRRVQARWYGHVLLLPVARASSHGAYKDHATGANPITHSTEWIRQQSGYSSLHGFPTASTPHNSFPATTLCSNHDRRIPAAEGEGRCSLLAGCGHRWAESREGNFEYHAGEGCFWLRRHPSHHDTGNFPSLLRRDVTGSHTARIRWQTKRIMSSSGYPALISVEPLNGE